MDTKQGNRQRTASKLDINFLPPYSDRPSTILSFSFLFRDLFPILSLRSECVSRCPVVESSLFLISWTQDKKKGSAKAKQKRYK